MNEDVARGLLLRSLKEDGFILNYQPIYNTVKKDFTKAEVLLRMSDFNGGIVYPAEFIPIAEKSGLIVEIGYTVVKKLCAFMKTHGECKICFSVNVSPIQMQDRDFAD